MGVLHGSGHDDESAGVCRVAPALFLAFQLIALSGVDAAAEDGERLFKNCATCHEIGEGAKHKVGPHLDGLFGRTAGGLADFRYSDGMRKAGEDGLVWDASTLSQFLEKPRGYIKGNRMSYRGMPDADDRNALIGWLETATQSEPHESPAIAAVSEAHGEVHSFTDIVLKIDGDPDYGEYLAGDCLTCHQASGHADGIPSIVGLPKDYFIRSLFEYRTNVRSNEVMKLRVANLANDEIAALAAYFSSLEPQ